MSNQTLGDALPLAMAHVRQMLIPRYVELGTGALALAVMQSALARAEKAIADGDVVEMMRAYQALKGYE